MDEAVVMVARPAEDVGQARSRQRARPIVIGDVAVGIAPAERVQREEQDDAEQRRGRERPAAQQTRREQQQKRGERKSVVQGKSVSERVELGGGSIIKKN